MAQGRTGAKDTGTAPAVAFFGALALLIGFAHSPWLRAAFLPEDYAARLGGGGAFVVRTLEQLLPLPAPGAAAPASRLESVLCLFAFSLGANHLLRRALLPWVGKERARTSGLLAQLFLLVHPALVDAAAPEAVRAGRVALALAGAGGGFFLAGRQDGREGRTAAALVLCFLAGTFSPDVAPLALVLALTEYTSAHRHRPRSLRLRTAGTTALLFGVAFLLPRLWVARASEAPLGVEADLARERLARCVEELGRLCIPAGEAAGLLAMLGCGGVLLLVFQPLFRAARSAPRLWGGLFTSWGAALALALLWWSLAPAGGAAAQTRELFAVGVLCAGLAVGASALSPERARWITLVVAALYAPVGHANARPRLLAGGRTGVLAERLHARVPAGVEPVFALTDAEPQDAWPRDVGWLLHPRLWKSDSVEAVAAFDPLRVRPLPRAAVTLLARRGDELPGLLGHALVLLGDEPPVVLTSTRGGSLARDARPWRAELGVTFEPALDPRSLAALEVMAELGMQPAELDTLAWRGRDGREGSVRGEVREERGRRVARYDLSAALDWYLSGEVRSLSIPAGKRAIERATYLDVLPVPGGTKVPESSGSDWRFALQSPAESDSVRLLVLAPRSGAYREFAVLADGPGRWRAPEVARFVRAVPPSDPLLWSLEFLRGEHVLARLDGARAEPR